MRLPTGLALISILAVILGVMGLVSSPLACLGTIFGQAMGDLTQDSSLPLAAAEAQEELYRRTGWLMVPSILVSVLTGLLAMTLVAGGGGTLAKQPWGLQLLRLGATAGLVVATLKAILAIANAAVAWAPTRDMMEALASDAGSLPPGFSEGMQVGAVAGLILGLVFSLAWYAAKMAFYLTAIRILRSDETREFRDAIEA